MSADRPRIVIVGAGPSGLATAAALTSVPDWQDRYSVDVYQMGWRIGGKCATGRNEDAADRIQEHGIHVFGNMYFNALHMVRQVFDEWNASHPDQPPLRMQDEFLPSVTTWNTEYFDGAWHQYIGYFPDTEGDPWDDPDGEASVSQIVQGALFVANRNLERALYAPLPEHATWAQRVGFRIRGWTRGVVERSARSVAHRMDVEMHRQRRGEGGDGIGDDVVDLLEAVVDAMGVIARRRGDVETRLMFTQVDLVVTALRGMVADDLFARDIDDLDHENYRDWLIRHGLDPLTQVSGIPQGYPNTALSYEYGDTTAVPTMSAAAWLTFFVRQMAGVGAGAYFFRRGTGETVMKPLFEVLRDRGVRFHFFHKLREVQVDGDRVTALHFDVQATVHGGAEYQPLRPILPVAGSHEDTHGGGVGELVWPDRPLYDQLEQGDELRDRKVDLESWWTDWQPVGTHTLHVDAATDGFEHVVLATPVATLPHTCAALLHHPAHGARWSAMCNGVRTAATQAVQLWLNRPVKDLGWPRTGTTSATDRYVGGFYAQDLTSSCDFSDLIPHERWGRNGGLVPQGLVYLIGALPDPEPIPGFDDVGYPERMRERVRWASVQFLRDISGLLPGAVNPRNTTDARSFDFELLVQHDDVSRRGVNRFDTQYWRANIEPNERYTLTVAGTLQHRMKGWENGFDNLVLAGDWVYTGFNIGSFEGAVISGKLAALALVGQPALDTIWGYTFLHPGLQGPPAPRITTPG
jgi:uncharacterized protein with NAD-binding domain and iron-sulfur cluster